MITQSHPVAAVFLKSMLIRCLNLILRGTGVCRPDDRAWSGLVENPLL